MYDVGFEPGSEILWTDHYAVYWDLTQRTYREAFDPGYDGATKAGTPFCRTGTAPGTPTACDAQYDYASRPQAVKDAVASVSLTGKIRKPMITLHGDLDALLPINADSDVYTEMIADAGRGGCTATTRSRAATTSTTAPTSSRARSGRSCPATARRSSA